MNKFQDRKIISIVILAISLLQAIIVSVRYFQSDLNLSNPLIPDSLLNGIRNFTIAMVAIYVFVVLLNVFYLATKKLFLPIAVLSILILSAGSYFTSAIHDYFINFR
ncbi:hypothetical protein HYN59_17805 [Flavobacterium album]|uniref:DUF4386 domain-containing protein n=1 Tax=Flavobacterium album TaxID=2175091 RepID=A0A2S1R2D6_9FLAO|nr:hypothetical protein HYN59_17805 [Flavobacterium album]